MELRQLRYFVAVAEAGNISRAAQKIFLTQPALSRQIKALEDEIGQTLLERLAHSIRLTPSGELLLNEARELLQQADDALERVRACNHGMRLRVGYAPSLASGVLTCAVENFVQRHKDVRVELLDLSSQEILAGLEAGTLDVGLSVAPGHDTRALRWTPLVQVSWQLAVNHQHPLAQLLEVTPEQAFQEPLLVFCQRNYPEYWNTIVNWLREQGKRPNVAGEYDGVSSLLSAVESRLGVAVVTTGSIELIPKRVQLKPLTIPPKAINIAVGHREDRASEKSVSLFIDELLDTAKSALSLGHKPPV